MSVLPWLSLLACGAGGFDMTWVQELRVVAVETEPPEAQPGERVSVTVHVANPAGFDVEVMFWTCLLYQGRCLEADFAENLAQWVTIGTLVDNEVVVAREVPREVDEYLEEGSTVPVQVLALACVKGRCPIFDQVREGMDLPYVPEEIAAQLADPTPWLGELPMEVVALAGRAYPVSTRDPSGRNENPEFDPRFAESLDEVMVLPRGEDVDLSFWAADPNGETIYAFPLTTAGSFEERKVKVDDEEVRLWLRTPDAATGGTVWVTFDDRDGGVGIYHQDFVVE